MAQRMKNNRSQTWGRVPAGDIYPEASVNNVYGEGVGGGSRELYVFKIQMNKKTLTSTFSYEMPWYDVPCILHSAKPLSQSLLKIKPWFRILRGHLGSGRWSCNALLALMATMCLFLCGPIRMWSHTKYTTVILFDSAVEESQRDGSGSYLPLTHAPK